MNYKALMAAAAVLAFSAVSCGNGNKKSPPETDYGEVTRTIAAADTTPEETTANTTETLSSGKEETVIMPDLTGISSELAQDMLRMLELECEIKNQSDSEVNQGCVISSDPEPDTEVNTGETIILYVSE